MIPRRLIVDPDRLERWSLVVVANVATWVLVRPSAYLALTWAYQRDGFDWGRASRWVGIRELASGSPISSFGLMYPLLVVTTVVFPLCVLLPWRWWWVGMLVLWPFAFAGALWRIAAFC